jgi:hypothetical protein
VGGARGSPAAPRLVDRLNRDLETGAAAHGLDHGDDL